MGTLSDYFDRVREPAVFEFGTRVFGRVGKIPFIGTTGFDGTTSEVQGPEVTVLLDLPAKINGVYVTVLRVKRQHIKKLKSYD